MGKETDLLGMGMVLEGIAFIYKEHQQTPMCAVSVSALLYYLQSTTPTDKIAVSVGA